MAAETAAYFYLHIFKTAGTSLTHMLDGLFPPDQVCPAWNWELLAQVPREDLARFRCFRGHLSGDLSGYLGRPLREFTVVRDPVTRAVSQYAQIVRDPEHRLHGPVRALGSFGAYLRDPRLGQNLRNHQAKYLAARATPGQLPTAMESDLPVADLLVAAQERLDAMACVGTTERLDAFVALLCHTFHWNPPEQMLRLNANPGPDSDVDMSAADHDLLMEANVADLTLHRMADLRLTAGLRAMAAHSKA